MEWLAAPSADELVPWHRHALDLNDEVVPRLELAKLSLELGGTVAGLVALDEGLAADRRLVSELLGHPDVVDLRHGALRRSPPPGP